MQRVLSEENTGDQVKVQLDTIIWESRGTILYVRSLRNVSYFISQMHIRKFSLENNPNAERWYCSIIYGSENILTFYNGNV